MSNVEPGIHSEMPDEVHQKSGGTPPSTPPTGGDAGVPNETPEPPDEVDKPGGEIPDKGNHTRGEIPD